jgi:hypothetical protein
MDLFGEIDQLEVEGKGPKYSASLPNAEGLYDLEDLLFPGKGRVLAIPFAEDSQLFFVLKDLLPYLLQDSLPEEITQEADIFS